MGGGRWRVEPPHVGEPEAQLKEAFDKTLMTESQLPAQVLVGNVDNILLETIC